ncbi:hypothetical protein ABC345_08910 [Shouchella sp. 1P09AA]|uniref:hypothetical protein n=1 Tax=Bacillaceae TaxID=186817 RepID=UPI00159BCDDC|nr:MULTISPECIES: hypothetical protein [Bacillaceae]UTR08123.1 hypothetical protein MM326_08955 [Alkalihalobacillus sp. LMS6]
MKKTAKKSTESILPAFFSSPFTMNLQKKNKEAIQLFNKWKKEGKEDRRSV